MRRITACILALLLLVGCAADGKPVPAPVQPVTFYYRTAKVGFSDENGLIRGETRDLGSGNFTEEDIFTLYFRGPVSGDLVSPIPSAAKLIGAKTTTGELTIQLEESIAAQSGIDQSVFLACLVKTGLGLDGVHRVRIRISSPGDKLIPDLVFSEEDILLYDSGETPMTTTLTLYFSDAERRQLLAEERTIPYLEPENQPAYVVRALLKPPQTAGMVSLLPVGTSLLDINVKDETCRVDFSPEFYSNRPTDEQACQLVLLSIANTLCELPEISRVEFFVEGIRLNTYQTIPLAEPFTSDASVIGPIRGELNEFEGTLCLPGQNEAVLHRLAVRVRLRVNVSHEQALLTALFTRGSQNGLWNPMSALTPPLDVQVRGTEAFVSLAPGSLDSLSADERVLALRCMTATLAETTGVRQVSFESDGTPLAESPMRPSSSWFAVASDDSSRPAAREP